MTWSTREIADLAGMSVRAVRYYHDVGLLEQPARRANGYKRYEVTHLVRLLRIKRLTDLRFSLAQIAAMGSAEEYPADELSMIDAELATTIERLQRIRVELAVIRREGAPTDLPPDLATATAGLSMADRAFVVVMTRVLGPVALGGWREMLPMLHSDPAVVEFDNLAGDADEPARRGLAEQLIPHIRQLRAAYPAMQDVGPGSLRSPQFIARTIRRAVDNLYNPAQLDVLNRINHALGTPSRYGHGS